MRVAAIVFLCIAAALSFVLMLPDLQWLLPIVLFSLLRAAALVLALLLLIGSGGLDRWRMARGPLRSRGILAVLATIGASLALCVCVALQSVRYDELPGPYPALYWVLVRALPLCVITAAFWPSRVLFIGGVAGALFTGVYASETWDSLHERYRAEAPLRARQVEEARAREIAPVMTALAQVPRDAGVEPLLDFVLRKEPHEAYWEALRRIKEMPDAFEQFSRLLDGGRPLDVLDVLARTVDERPRDLPEDLEDHAWLTAAKIARGMMDRNNAVPLDEIERLCGAVDRLVYNRAKPWTLPERHRAESITVRDWMKAAADKYPLCSVASYFVLDRALMSPPGDQKP